MRLFDVKIGFNATTVLSGVWMVLLMPAVVNSAPKIFRSTAKNLIKAGLIISRKMRIVYWEAEPSLITGGAGEVYSAEVVKNEIVR